MPATQMINTAIEFLASLGGDQHQQASWPFPSNDERRLWFYTPTNHGGLPLSEMTSVQQRLVFRLLASGLSEAGYVTAATIMGLENILDRLEGFTSQFQRPRGRDPQLYWVSIFGTPSTGSTWGWRFGGHHISIHFTLMDGRVVSTTPCFFGADPASSPLLGPHLNRPLAAVEDLGRELVRSLDESQGSMAIVSTVAPADLVGANRTRLTEGDRPIPLNLIWRGRFEGELDRALTAIQQRAETELGLRADHLDALAFSKSPKGLLVSDMTPGQQEILRTLLHTYVGRISDDLADAQMSKFHGSALGALRFLWAGGTESGEPHYYRVQGGSLFVEYDNSQRGANHVHSVWRDLNSDFGGDPLADHYVRDGNHH